MILLVVPVVVLLVVLVVPVVVVVVGVAVVAGGGSVGPGVAPPLVSSPTGVGLAAVLDATTEYFSDQDTLQQWLDDCTEDGGEFAFTRTTELFASWKMWCEARNLKPGSEQGFSGALRDKDFQKKRNGVGQMGFRNLVLRTT